MARLVPPLPALPQTEVENQVAAVEQLMGSIVRLVLGRGPKGSSVAGASKAGGRGQGTSNEAVKVACMLSIQEYIGFCHRLKILPELLEEAAAVDLQRCRSARK